MMILSHQDLLYSVPDGASSTGYRVRKHFKSDVELTYGTPYLSKLVADEFDPS